MSVFRGKVISLASAAKGKFYRRFLINGLQITFEVRFALRFFSTSRGANRKTNERGRVDRGKGAKSEP